MQELQRRRTFIAYRHGRLTVSVRLVLVERMVVHGWPVTHAATAPGIGLATAYKWWAR
ncbi:MAG: hypothetical protein F4Y02_01500 [Chloroflexi bacterium]|nr:hypothetical protein [Chloroflexota bacterium]